MTIAARATALLIAALAAGACAHKAKDHPAEAVPEGITLERQPCYGTCPVYLLTISGAGRVFFEGRRHVDSIGKFTADISAARFTALRKLFNEKQFFDLDSTYVMGAVHCSPYASDAPIVITSIVTQGHVKKVEHDGGCAGVPARLGELERAIDQAAGTARWIGRR